jgi:arylsulfatase A-like enzyme
VIPLLLALATCAPQVADRRPNVLVVVLDDVAERDIDRIPTPRFDGLAAGGLRFRRAYSAPTCSPARRSLQFGEYFPSDSGNPCDGPNPRNPSPKAFSLPKLFRSASYQTAIFGKWHLGAYPGVATGKPWELTPQKHGYDIWRAGIPRNVQGPGKSTATRCQGRNYEFWLRVDDGRSRFETRYCDEEVRDAFLSWLPGAEAVPAPWFAVVNFQSPHGPFHVPPGFQAGSSPSKRRRYELMLQNVDAYLGQLLDAVNPRRTLVIVVGDNGTPDNATGPGQKAHKVKKSTYEDGVRVPMVWSGPGFPRGVETRSIVHFVDVLPTLCEYLGRVPPDGLDGSSLRPLVENPEARIHEYVFTGGGKTPLSTPDFAVVTQRWKYRERSGKPFLFDLARDPKERVNLHGRPDLAELEAELFGYLRRHVP